MTATVGKGIIAKHGKVRIGYDDAVDEGDIMLGEEGEDGWGEPGGVTEFESDAWWGGEVGYGLLEVVQEMLE